MSSCGNNRKGVITTYTRLEPAQDSNTVAKDPG